MKRVAVAGAVEKRLTFRSGRTLILYRLTAMSVLVLWLAFLVVFLPLAIDFWVLLLAGVVAAYVIVFGMSPLLTEHWLTRSRLILRQGWYFRAVIPFSDIDSIEPADRTGPLRAPLGIHRPLGQPALFVTGGRTNLVTLRLRRSIRFWQSFGLAVREIVFDVVDRPRFLQAFEERRALLPPIEAEGPYA